jgi:peptidoglycan endopeptidase LytE
MKKTIVAGTILTSLFLGEKAASAAEYTVKPGDSLWKIAKTFQLSISELKTYNKLTSDTIFVGQVLQLPDSKITLSSSVPKAATAVQPTAATTTYKIQSGDSLSVIARKFNTTVTRLLELNPTITNEHRIYVGQVIKVPSVSSSSSSSQRISATEPKNTASGNGTYIVQSGDSLSLIAKKFGLTLNELLAMNPAITNLNIVRVGQVLTVPMSWQQKANAIIETGKKYLGAKYLFGAPVTRTDVFDCSSFTYRVYQENGIALPRTSREQAMIGTEIPLSDIRTGDLIFFDTNGDGIINHVSIVVDSETLLHAATSTGVAFSNMKPYWAPRAVKAVRVF